MLSRSKLLVFAAASLFALSTLTGCSSGGTAGSKSPADDFPKQPITLVVPYAAGGGTDVLCRKLADQVKLGQPVTVVNKDGGVTAPAMLENSRAKPDGYNLLVVSTPISTLRHITSDVKISWQDFNYIMGFNEDVYCITVKKDAKWNSVKELVQYAKENPGKINFGTAGPGGTWYMSALSFIDATGINVKIMPHPKGTNEIRTALLGGHVDLIAVSVGEVKDFVKNGQLKILAVAGKERHKDFPDVPTLEQEGIKAVPVSTFRGIVGPKGMPQPVVEKLHAAFKEALHQKDTVDFMDRNGFYMKYMPPAEWKAYLEEQDKIFGSLAELHKKLDTKK